MELHIVSAGRTWVDPGGPFGLVPEALWKRHHKVNEQHLLPMELNCLLIKSEGKIILVDNGLGDKLNEKKMRQWHLEYPDGTLLENLARLDIRPEQIDIVLDTHLHSDHCGGNTMIVDGKVVPTYPNAEYWVQGIEWGDAMNTNARTRSTYFPENFLPIWEAGQFRFLQGDTQVTKDIRCVVTPGHTRGHQCILIERKNGPLLYIADLASFAIHFQRSAWVTSYDVEPLETIRTKSKWQKWALENKAKLIFEHDPTMLVGQLMQDDDGRLSMRAVDDY